MKKNPFEILGITPEMVKKLRDEDLFRLVRSNYRVLQMIYHPDTKAGRRLTQKEKGKSRDINISFESLNFEKNKESFQEHKEQYVKRLYRGLRKLVSQLEGHLKSAEKQGEYMADNFMGFLLHNINKHDGMGLLDLKNICLGLHDVAIGYNLRSSPWVFGKNYKEIAFDREGKMFYKLPGRERFDPINHIKLIGVVGEDNIDPIPLLDKTAGKAPTLYDSLSIQTYGKNYQRFEVRNTIHKSNFKKYCLPFLSLNVHERSYLFSIRLDGTHGQSHICLEGMIIKIAEANLDQH